MSNKREHTGSGSYRCLYPLVAEELDPVDVPHAFEFTQYDWEDQIADVWDDFDDYIDFRY